NDCRGNPRNAVVYTTARAKTLVRLRRSGPVPDTHAAPANRHCATTAHAVPPVAPHAVPAPVPAWRYTPAPGVNRGHHNAESAPAVAHCNGRNLRREHRQLIATTLPPASAVATDAAARPDRRPHSRPPAALCCPMPPTLAPAPALWCQSPPPATPDRNRPRYQPVPGSPANPARRHRLRESPAPDAGLPAPVASSNRSAVPTGDDQEIPAAPPVPDNPAKWGLKERWHNRAPASAPVLARGPPDGPVHADDWNGRRQSSAKIDNDRPETAATSPAVSAIYCRISPDQPDPA